jgi:glutaredoxin 3
MPKVVMYTTSYCPYCRAAKKLLQSKGVTITEIDVENDDTKRRWLVEKTGQKTVPQIFIDDKPYGGFEDIEKLDMEDKLDKILGLT